MSNLKNFSNKFLIVCIVILFISFSCVKLYTIQVSFSNDPTVAIVKTKNIQWVSNTFKIDREPLSYNWYDNYEFKIVYADEIDIDIF